MNFIDKKIPIIKKMLVFLMPLLFVFMIVYIKFFYVSKGGINCITYTHFGIYCMGCGTTRQLYYLINGDIKTAFFYNVGCIVIYPALAYLYYLIVGWSFKDKKIKTRQAYILAGLAVVLVIYMILRNIPLAVFDILRP